MASVTALSVIQDSLTTLGVYSTGDTINNADAQTGLTRLNWMVRALNLGPLMGPVIAREVFALTTNKGSSTNPYTIGVGGDFNTTRPAPNAIVGAGLLLGGTSPTIEIPRQIITDDQYQALRVKDLPNALFTAVYYNATWSGSLGTIYLWPVPNTNIHSLALYRQQLFSDFSSLSASYVLPDGYEEMLSSNLAVRLAAPFGKTLGPDVVALAQTSLGAVKRSNVKMTDVALDPMWTSEKDTRGWFNINDYSNG